MGFRQKGVVFMATRATRHNGRKGKQGGYSSKHNGREFDLEQAENIDASKTPNNIYWNCIDNCFYRHSKKADKLSFEEAETKYLKKTFGRQWADTNYKYQCNGHSERCKTWEEWISQDRNLPEESCLQVGNMEEHCSEQQLFEATKRYLTKMQNWSKQHGNCFQFLDLAFHFDEATPHFHERKIWQYRNQDGVWCIGQEKALEQAGIPLPDPSKKKGRYNNRKMVFDKMAREMFLESCKEVGLEIIEQPIEGAVHNRSKQQFIYDKIRQQQQDLDDREAKLAVLKADLEAKALEVEEKDRKATERLKKANNSDIEVFRAYIRTRGFTEDFKNFYMAYGETGTEPQLNTGLSL